MAYGEYVVRLDNQAVTGAITLTQITAPSTAVLELVKVTLSQSNLTTNANQQVQILRKSATVTGTSFTPVPVATGMAAAGATALVNATVEGTDSTVVLRDAFSWLAGWQWVAMDEEERIVVPPSGILAVKLPIAPGASTTVQCQMTFKEIG